MKKNYAIIKPSYDGGFDIIEIKDIDEFLDDPKDIAGVSKFKGELKRYCGDYDEEEATLITYEVVIPKEKTKAWSIE